MVRYHTFYYDPRGAWREWCEYKSFKLAKEAVPRNYEWMIEKRTSYIIAQSDNANKYGKIDKSAKGEQHAG